MEQDKWMQGLLIALKNNSSTQSRLSHYRFSSCDFGPLELQVELPIFSNTFSQTEKLSEILATPQINANTLQPQ